MDSTLIAMEKWSPVSDSQALKSTDTPSQMDGWTRETVYGAKAQFLGLLMEHVKPPKKVKQACPDGSEATLVIQTQTTM